jgi:membrane protein required for colicin V production
MNWLDIVIVVVVIIAALAGLKVGIIKALLTVAGVVVGVILAGRLSPWLGERLTFISSTGAAKVTAFAIILIVVIIIFMVAAIFLNKVLSSMALGWVNRLGGAVLGLFLAGLFCGAVLTMWVKFLGAGGTIEDSVMAKFLLNGFPIVLGLLPADFDSVRSFLR